MSTTFLRTFLSRPGQVGAIAPSSRFLAQCMVDSVDWESARYVVEYGPGTGAFTGSILRSLHPEAKFFAIERSPELCDVMRGRFPQLDLSEGSVEEVASYCQERGFPRIDAVICGLPWASFPDGLQKSCLDAMATMLAPSGQFATFAYWQGLLLPAAHRFRHRLDQYFSNITRSHTVWRNLPPAFVYRCRR